jgi:hypothetical protein
VRVRSNTNQQMIVDPGSRLVYSILYFIEGIIYFTYKKLSRCYSQLSKYWETYDTDSPYYVIGEVMRSLESEPDSDHVRTQYNIDNSCVS